jgi:hypothetical protein
VPQRLDDDGRALSHEPGDQSRSPLPLRLDLRTNPLRVRNFLALHDLFQPLIVNADEHLRGAISEVQGVPDQVAIPTTFPALVHRLKPGSAVSPVPTLRDLVQVEPPGHIIQSEVNTGEGTAQVMQVTQEAAPTPQELVRRTRHWEKPLGLQLPAPLPSHVDQDQTLICLDLALEVDRDMAPAQTPLEEEATPVHLDPLQARTELHHGPFQNVQSRRESDTQPVN